LFRYIRNISDYHLHIHIIWCLTAGFINYISLDDVSIINFRWYNFLLANIVKLVCIT
jgi:hypothetical protein